MLAAEGSVTPVYEIADPPSITQARQDFNNRLNKAMREFHSESIHATAVGIRDMEEGRFITLEDLKARLNIT